MIMDVTKLTVKSALAGMEAGEFSSQELTLSYLDRIKKFNPKYHAFINVNPKAIDEAKSADNMRRKGKKLPLLGIPVGPKDNFSYQGIKSTAASKLLDNYVPQYDSTAITKLKTAGAVVIGKTNLDAWGHGSSGEHTDYGITHNPYAYDRVTGGSSSGSGTAVAADLCLMGTGSDTGGSNRQPGSYCNVVGIKPTYGRVSRYGIIAMASSTDSIGPLTKTVYDAAKFLSVMAGRDEKDATTVALPVPQYHLNLETQRKFTLGLIKEYFDGLDKKYVSAIEATVKKLEARGHKIKQLSIPTVKYAYPMYCLTVFTEIASNLSRFDGIRFGDDRERFGDEAKRRIMIGTHSASSGYSAKYYQRAMTARKMLTYQYKQALETVDAFIGPVFPFPPFKINERETDPLKMYLSDVLTVPANLTGQPAMSVPIEFVDELPNGLQIICKHFDEQTMFQIAYQVEQEYQMYKIRPKLI